MKNNRIQSINQAQLDVDSLASEIMASVGSGDFLRVMDAAIQKLGIELTSEKAKLARDKIKFQPKNSAAALTTMVADEHHAREAWLKTTLEPWCKRHGITLKQGLGILLEDSAFNAITGNYDPSTKEGIISWKVQQLNFANYIIMEIEAGIR